MRAKHWISTLVIIILVVGAGYLVYRGLKPKPQSGSASHMTVAVQPVFASQGQVIDTFPKDLIMGGDTVTQTSYKVSYANSNQNTAVYDTSDAIGTIYQDYLAYLKKNTYNIVNNQMSAKGDSAQIFAIGAGGSVSVQITAAGGKSHVSATFLKQ